MAVSIRFACPGFFAIWARPEFSTPLGDACGMKPIIKAVTASAICGFSSAILFLGFSSIAYFGEWEILAYWFFVGLFVGFIGAPEFAPGSFKSAWRFQVGSGIASGIFVGLGFSLSVSEIVMAAIIGGILGWFAPVVVGNITPM